MLCAARAGIRTIDDRLQVNCFFIIFFLPFFLGGKTCCAFDCMPNVDAAIEDKIKDRQKATLQATGVIHACRKESLFFLSYLDGILSDRWLACGWTWVLGAVESAALSRILGQLTRLAGWNS